eukprot:Blabericola_migrator_1__10564@NODE_5_length_29060_cov_171_088642_g4_i0_p10_GENE_NODE_5_length_29060_cov_171_088642_g4_i0NODE_5_length_29060_cov_171_088642_g4_i0_p10_ORF_typecomplete_len318_score53_11_NODE_5_length_29060_cov_171_088642_g4_i068347787
MPRMPQIFRRLDRRQPASPPNTLSMKFLAFVFAAHAAFADPRARLRDALDTNLRYLQAGLVAAAPDTFLGHIRDLQFTDSDNGSFLYNTIVGQPKGIRGPWLYSHFFTGRNAVWYLTPDVDTEDARMELIQQQWHLPVKTLALYHDVNEPFEELADEVGIAVIKAEEPEEFRDLAERLRYLYETDLPIEAAEVYEQLTRCARSWPLGNHLPEVEVYYALTPQGFGGAFMVSRQLDIAILYDLTFALWPTLRGTTRALANAIVRDIALHKSASTVITRAMADPDTLISYSRTRWRMLGDFDVFFHLEAVPSVVSVEVQ